MLAIAAMAALCAFAASAHAMLLQPRGDRVYFGVSDTGNPGDFGEFAKAVGQHPAVIESFRTWGSDFPDSIQRWQTARARPMLHISTADSHDGHELISPEAIAKGEGDEFLVRLNKLFWNKHMPAYIRPLGEPNRCLNIYSSYECAGNLRDEAHRPRWYRLAFRRMYVILHGGGRRAKIDARLAAAGLPPLNADVRGLPQAPVALIWAPLPTGSPAIRGNRPINYFPGAKWVDWTGTDFYASYAEWGALNRIYRLAPGKPFAFAEWGMEAGDDPGFVSRLFSWVRRHDRCKMLIFYQDFGSSSPYRIQNYPASLDVLRAQLRSPRFPSFVRGAPHRPPPPPPPSGGVGAGHGHRN